MKLTATLKDWIAALRSGEYQQNKNTLTNKDRTAHCCLGIMCEIDPNVKYRADSNSYLLGSDYHLEIELLGVRPEWMSKEQEIASIYANDELDWTFDQIADWWESGAEVSATNLISWPWKPAIDVTDVT